MRRIFDVFISSFVLLLGFPFCIIIALIIFLFDFGAPFFYQYRVGQYGKQFKLIKLRTMSINKFDFQGSFDVGNNSRVTKIGKFLRKIKADEFPQFLNVLKGDMSIVGPRPEVKYWVNVYPERWAIVHQMKPGITDNASIEFRNEEEILAKSQNPKETYQTEILPRKLELYEEYIRDHSIMKDINIIIRTIYIILTT